MNTIQKIIVRPNLPEKLQPLMEIAYNLWWVWNPDATALFEHLDRDLWEQSDKNPVKLLGLVPQETYQKLLTDMGFQSHMERVYEDLQNYMKYTTWYDKLHGKGLGSHIAYFSLEFGLHECLPIYSGGLGILSGDHLKSTSELGLPISGVGLLYRHGYFKQYLNQDGWQQEEFPVNDTFNMPITQVMNDDGAELLVDVDYPGRKVWARVWKIQVGRISLYLLDTNLERNSVEDRKITANLYGGDLEMRIRQEFLLGIGGFKMLEKLNKFPTVCHMNEGHSAFLALERIKNLRQRGGLSFEEAYEVVFATTTFTTHTPVPAGNDMFPPELVEKYFKHYVYDLGLTMDQLLGLGRQNPADETEPFCMTVLALKLASGANGVSELHGHVSRNMWKNIWPELPKEEVPISHITNGIHIQSWYSDEIARLFDRYVGPEWTADPVNQTVWKRITKIPDSELWRARERLRERFVAFARKRLKQQLKHRGAHQTKIKQAQDVLDPEILTIGFARRFATYKRATLILYNLQRLERILNNTDRPVQIVFAGKAHPNDHPGKELIREIIHLSNREEFRRRIVFLEDYNMTIGRALIQGVDVWLNTPRRPMEASGTSGMKAAVNGALNVSILDGWWCEGYTRIDGHNTGWAIGSGEDYMDHSYQDEVENRNLYDILENEVIPTFYDRSNDGLPHEWIAMMKSSMQHNCPNFNTNRMVEEYTERFYLPSILQWNWFENDNWQEAKKLARWKAQIKKCWKGVKITRVAQTSAKYYYVGDTLNIKAAADLNTLSPSDVTLEIYSGHLTPEDTIEKGKGKVMKHIGRTPDGKTLFEGSIPFTTTGHHGYTLRIFPYNRSLLNKYDGGYITWLKEPYQRREWDHPEMQPVEEKTVEHNPG